MLVSVDLERAKVKGPDGELLVGKGMSFVLRRLANGDQVPMKELMRLGTWTNIRELYGDLTRVEPKLESIGIGLTIAGGMHEGKLRLRLAR
jgi:hypothetical protein